MFTNRLLHGQPAATGRRFVVVDIENIVGGAVQTIDQAANAHERITEAAGLRNDEQVVLGSSHVGAVDAQLGWGSSRLRVRSGPDGADLELLEVLTTEHIAERFAQVVLVSGDGIFTDAVARLEAAGVPVTVVSRPEACSTRLALAASRTIYLQGNDDINCAGAA